MYRVESKLENDAVWRLRRKRREKEERIKPKIDWNEKPVVQHGSGTKHLKVRGPVKIDLSSVTPGLDGLIYDVDWLPLDKNGNVVPEWRSPDHKPLPGGGYSFIKAQEFHPPYENPYGFRVQIRIPPQPIYHGNSSGVHLNIFTPKGQSLIGGKGK